MSRLRWPLCQRLAAVVAIAAPLAAFDGSLSAAEFTAKATGNWDNPNTWNSSVSGTFPGAGDTVVLGGFNVTVPTAIPATFSGGSMSVANNPFLGLNSTLTLDSGTFNFAVNASGNSVVSGAGGSWIISPGAEFLYSGSNSVLYFDTNSGTFNNQGLFRFATPTSGTFRLRDSGNTGNQRFLNSGTLAATSGTGTILEDSAARLVKLPNTGIIRADGAGSRLVISAPLDSTSGTIEGINGGIVQFSGTGMSSGHTSSASTIFGSSGGGAVWLGGMIGGLSGTIAAGSDVRIASLTSALASGTSFIDFGNTQIGWGSSTAQAANFGLSTGRVLEFRSPVIYDSSLQQLIQGGGSLVNKSLFTVSTTSIGLYLQGATLDNTGTIRFAAVTGTNRIYNQGSNTPNSYLYNRAGGVIEATSGTGNFITFDSSTSAAIAATRRLFNSGTIQANGGNLIVNAQMTNEAGGVLAANDGILRFTDSASSGSLFGDGIIFEPSTVLSTTPTGTISLGGYIGRLQGSITGSGAVVLGERMTGAANSFIDFGSTVLNWTAADPALNSAILVNGNVLEFRSPVSRTVQSPENYAMITGTGTLKVAGTTSLSFDGASSLGNLRLRQRAIFLNSGTLNAEINNGLLSAFDINVAGGTPTFVNEGLLRKTTSGTLRISGLSGSGTAGTFSNTGTLEVVAGAGGNATLLTGTATGSGLVFQQLTGGTMLTGGTYRAISSGTATATIGISSVANGAITTLGSGAAVYLEQTDTSGVQRALLPQLSSSSLAVNGRLTAMGTRTISITNVAVGATGLLDGNGTFTGSFTNAAGGQISLSSGGLLVSTGTLANDGVITLAGATLRPSAAITGSGSIALAGPGTIDTSGFVIESSNAVTGAGSLVKTGAGWLRLSGAGSYSGGGTVSAGGLIFANRAAQPSTGTTSVAAGATLGVGVSAGDGAFFDAADVDALFAGTFAGVDNSTGVSNVGIDTSAGDFTYASNVSGPRGLVKYGANTLFLNGSNSFSGGSEVAGGSVVLGDADALGTAAATLSGGTLDLNGQSIGNAVVVTGGTLSGGTIDVSQVTSPQGGGRIAAVLSGTGGFTKGGSGTLVYAGANTYAGTTTLTGGTLLVERNSGSLPSSGGVTIASTAGLVDLSIDNAGATGALTQAIGPLSFEAGAGTVSLVRSAAQDLAVSTSGVSVAAGATGNLVPGGGTNSAANGFAITGQAAGFLDPGLYYDGSNFAWYDAGGFVRGINYGSDADTRTTGATSTNQTSIAHQQFTGNATGQTSGTFTTLEFTGVPTAYTLSSGQVTVTGLLKSGTGTTTMSGGSGIRSGSNADLEIRTDLVTGTLAISHAIAANGSNALTKSGAGTLSLSGVNTFTGVTRPLEGTILVAGASALQNSTLDLSSSGAGTVTFGINATLGGLTGSRDLDFGNRLITIGNNGGSTSYSGILSSGTLAKTGTGTLTLTGASTLAGITSIRNGSLEIDSLPAAGQASPLGTAGTINLGNSTTAGLLRYTGSGDTSDRVINLAGTTGGATIDASGSGALVLTAANTATGAGSKTFTLTGTSTAANSIGSIDDNSGANPTSVVKEGSGLWRLSALSGFTGRLSVKAGTIVAELGVGQTGPGVFGAGTGDAQLPLVGDSADGATGQAAVLLESGVTVGRGLSVAGLGAGATQEAILGGAATSGTATFAGGMSIKVGRDLTLQAADGGTVVFANEWRDLATGTSTPAVAFNVGSAGNAGTVVLDSLLPDSITAVTVRRGTLRLNGGTDTIGPATPVTIGAAGGGTVDINGTEQFLASLSFAGVNSSVSDVLGGGSLGLFNSGSAAAVNVAGTGHTISAAMVLEDAATFTVESGGRLGISSEIANGTSGARGLTKAGLGILELAGANTFTGNTTVSAGTLVVNGSLANGALEVAAGATLMGSGTIGGAATIFGIHSPGNSPGVVSFENNLTYSGSTSQVIWELWGNTDTNSPTVAFDQIIVGGTLDFADPTSLSLVFTGTGDTGSSTVNWSDPFWGSEQTWTLFDVGPSGTTTNFSNLSLVGDASSWFDSNNQSLATVRPQGSFSVLQNGNDVTISYVPEPATAVLALAGLGLAAAAARRRRRAKRGHSAFSGHASACPEID